MKRDELDLLIKNGFLQSEPDESISTDLLGNLVNHGFLEELPNQFFSFHNNLTWEVIYETLLYAEKRLLHNIIALHIEKYNKANLTTVSDILLYHFEKGRNFPKSVYYGAMAGDRAASLFANGDALSFYTRALNALDNIKRNTSSDRSLLHEHVGDVHEYSGNHKAAILSYKKALEIWRENCSQKKSKYVPWKIKPSTHEAFLSRKIAMSLEHDSEYDAALQWLGKAQDHLPKRPGRVSSQIAATKSAILYRKGEFHDALEYGKLALKLAKRSGRKQDEAYAHNMIANSFIESAHLNDAIHHLRKSELICISENDFPGIASANHNIGNCFYALGRLRDAVNSFENALFADEQMHNLSGITMGHFNLGNIFVDIGELPKSEAHLNQVITDFENGNCRRDLAGAALAMLGRCKRLQEDMIASEDAINKAIEILSKTDQSSILLHAKLQKVELLLQQNKLEDALQLGEEASKTIHALDAKLLLVQADRVLALVFSKLNNYDKAIELLNKSVTMASEMGLEHEEALTILELARIAVTTGKSYQAVNTDINRAIDILYKIGAKRDLAEARNLANQLH